LTGRGAVGKSPPSASGLGAGKFPSEEGGASLEAAELLGKLGGLHAVATVVESRPAGVDFGLQLLEVVLQVAERGLLAAVPHHLGVCSPVG
jgi:hypothetical protein